MELEYYDQAIICFDKALVINPNNAESWYNRGVALSILNRNEDAIQSYDRAIKLDSGTINAWNSKGHALSGIGKYADALRSYDRAIEIHSDNIIAWYNKGLALSNLGRYDEAIQSYDRVLEIDKNNTDALNSKGLALERLGKYDEAIQSYDRVLEIDKNNTDALNSKGLTLQRIGKKHEAMQCFEEVTAIYEEMVRINIREGDHLLQSTKYKEAIRAYDRVLKIDPNNIIAWYNKGLALSNLGRYDEAIQSYDRVLEIDKNNTDALNSKGSALERLGKYDEAIQSYDIALDLAPNNPDTWLRKARIKSRKHCYPEAIKCYNQAAALSPNDVAILTELREIYSNHTYEYNKALENALKLNQKNHDSLTEIMVAEDFIKSGDNSEGRKHANRASSITPAKSVKLRSIIEYLILCSYFMQGKTLEGDKKIKEFFEGYKSLDKGFRIEDEFWNFNGLIKAIERSSINDRKRRVLLDLINILRGHLYENTISGIVASLAYTSESLQRSNRRLRHVIIPSIVVAAIGGIVLGYFGFIEKEIFADECDKVGLIKHVNLKDSPGVMALHPSTHEMYMAYENRSFGVISCTDLDTESDPSPIKGGLGQAEAVAFDPSDNAAYIVHANSNNVTKIDTERNVVTNITVGNDPKGIAVDPEKNVIYVANRMDNNVSIIDTDDVNEDKTIPVGKWPIGVGLNSRTHMLYVANSGNNTVSVIDTNNETVLDHIRVGKAPNGIAVDPEKNRVYVANGDISNITDDVGQHDDKPIEQSYSNIITVIDGVSNDKKDITVGSGGFPKDIAIDDRLDKIYVANENSNTITEIDSNSNEVVRTIELPFRPNDIEINSDKGILYVSTSELEGLSELIRVGAPEDNIIKYWLNRANSTVELDGDFQLLQVDTRPTHVAVDNDTNRSYVSNYYSNTVSVIDTENDTVIDKITVSEGPNGIAVDPEKKRVYVANERNNTVSVIDTKTNKVTGNISVGRHPTSVALNPANNTLYVANSGNNTVSVINTETNNVTNDIRVGEAPFGVVVDPENKKVYVANFNQSTVSVINTEINNVTKNITVGKAPTSVAIDSENRVFVANSGEETISLIIPNYNDAVMQVPVGVSPTSMAIDPDNNVIYAVDQQEDIISIIKINDINQLIKQFRDSIRIRAGGSPLHSTSIFDLIPGAQERGYIEDLLRIPLPKGSEPLGIYFDQNNDKLYLANGNGNTVLIKEVHQDKLEDEKIISMS
jgi:YVTN family beta-propeller protein